MENAKIAQSQKILFSLIGQNLFSNPPIIPDDVDWNNVIHESKIQAVALLALQNYRQLPIDEGTAENIKKHLYKCTISNMACFTGHKYLHELMTKNGITYCVVKGVASARYYPNPLTRAMGDVDFYVLPEHLEKAREVFKADGFVFDSANHPYHNSMKKGKMQFEMHFKPIAAPDGAIGEIFNEYWSDICEKSRLVKDELTECVLPSDFHHGFILLTHLQSHLLSEGVGLRHVCDWAFFANSFSNEEFTALFEDRLKRVGLWRLAQILSLIAVRHMGFQHKPWMGDDYITADELLEDILCGGNFGVRERSRSYEGLFISDLQTTTVSKSRPIQIFHSMNMIVKRNWRAAEKCPLLYPVGWVYFSLRFLFRLLTGRRKANIATVYLQSGKRKKLYESLRLFVPEE